MNSSDETEEMEPTIQKPAGQVTLNQMLKALDKNLASGIEKKLKKLSKKKSLKAPLDKNKADQLERKINYIQASKDLDEWEDIVQHNRRAKQIKFPLDQQPEFLPSTAQAVGELKPINKLESEILSLINKSKNVLHDNKPLSKAEEKYLKAISADEAKERHLELQKARVLLSSYGAKMKRQKAIKSKSYRRLLKHEKLRKHMKKVESDKNLMKSEIEKLQKLRAQERASLKHKNTGKWAKQAKFRVKYDEEARKAMIEQIGIAEKLLEKPQPDDSDDSADDDDIISEKSDENDDDEMDNSDDEQAQNNPKQSGKEAKDKPNPIKIHTVVTTEAVVDRLAKYRDLLSGKSDLEPDAIESEEEEDEQRRLMSEAFADDDVVAEFEKAKEALAGEEQPKDINNFLPGWGGWAGPGIRINKRLKQKYIEKAKKLPRKDDKISNVIISEQADEKAKELMVQKLPRGLQNREQFQKILNRPLVGTFTSQPVHRKLVKPKIATKMGARIEPMNKRILSGNKKRAAAKWSG